MDEQAQQIENTKVFWQTQMCFDFGYWNTHFTRLCIKRQNWYFHKKFK